MPKVQQNDMPPQEAALLFLEKNIQALGAVQVTPVNPEPPKPAPAPRGVKALVPQQIAPVPLPYLDVTLTTGFAPDALPNLASVKGLRISQIQWSIPKAHMDLSIQFAACASESGDSYAGPADGCGYRQREIRNDALRSLMLALFVSYAPFAIAADRLCPDIEELRKTTPDTMAGVQADIDRMKLCVERAKLLAAAG
jgi:hypothetical protein